MRASLEQFIEQLGDYFLADVTLNFDYPYRLSKVKQAVMDVPGVTAVEGWAFASGEVIDPDGIALENVQILAPPADSTLIDPDMIQGRWIMPGDTSGITVSEKIWSIYPHLVPGDTIQMKVQDKKKRIGPLWVSSALPARKKRSLPMQITNTFQNWCICTSNRFPSGWSPKSIPGSTNPGSAGNWTGQLRARGFHISEAEAGLTTMRTVSEYVNILVAFLLIMALLTALVGSIGLTGTMGMNVLERTREIGVMRESVQSTWRSSNR